MNEIINEKLLFINLKTLCQPIVSSSPPLGQIPLPALNPPPIRLVNPLNHHSMITRAKNNIVKPSTKLTMLATTPTEPITELTCVSQALKDPRWHQAMSEEFDALLHNGTWDLVPRTVDQNRVGCK